MKTAFSLNVASLSQPTVGVVNGARSYSSAPAANFAVAGEGGEAADDCFLHQNALSNGGGSYLGGGGGVYDGYDG
jgi:hypothetical protein